MYIPAIVIHKIPYCDWRWLAVVLCAGVVFALPGCHSSDAVVDWNMRIYTAARDHIQTDTWTRVHFNHPGPFPVWVFDETACFHYDSFRKKEIWTEWLEVDPEDSVLQRRIWDSIDRRRIIITCDPGIDPDLRRLSTTDDRTYSLVFMQIDSTLRPEHYIVPVNLYHNENRLIHRHEMMFRTRSMLYIFLFDKNLRIRKVLFEPSDPNRHY